MEARAFYGRPLEGDNLNAPQQMQVFGSAALPDGAWVKVGLYYKAFNMGWMRGVVRGQKFGVAFAPFDRPLPPATYRIVLEFDPEYQFEDVAGLLAKLEPARESIDFSIGNPEIAAAFIQKRVDDMESLLKLISDQCAALWAKADSFRPLNDAGSAGDGKQPFDPAAWESWAAGWTESTIRIRRQALGMPNEYATEIFPQTVWELGELSALLPGSFKEVTNYLYGVSAEDVDNAAADAPKGFQIEIAEVRDGFLRAHRKISMEIVFHRKGALLAEVEAILRTLYGLSTEIVPEAQEVAAQSSPDLDAWTEYVNGWRERKSPPALRMAALAEEPDFAPFPMIKGGFAQIPKDIAAVETESDRVARGIAHGSKTLVQLHKDLEDALLLLVQALGLSRFDLAAEAPVAEVDSAPRELTPALEAEILALIDVWRSKEANPLDRGTAQMQMITIGRPAGQVLVKKRALYDPNHYVRGYAASVLGAIGDKEFMDALIERLRAGVGQKDEIEVRMYTAEALGMIASPDARESLEQAIDDPSELIRTVCAVSLGKLGDPRAVDTLAKALEDDNLGVRENARVAIENILRVDLSVYAVASAGAAGSQTLAKSFKGWWEKNRGLYLQEQ